MARTRSTETVESTSTENVVNFEILNLKFAATEGRTIYLAKEKGSAHIRFTLVSKADRALDMVYVDSAGNETPIESIPKLREMLKVRLTNKAGGTAAVIHEVAPVARRSAETGFSADW
jgi:hypothetical protein